MIAVGVLMVIAGFVGILRADPVPIYEPSQILKDYMREVGDHPDGYLRNWYIYADTKTDGILDPDDLKMDTMKNWWTTVSSGTTHSDINFFNGTVVSAPMSHVEVGSDPSKKAENSYAIPLAPRTLQFYMSYSQMDNNSGSNYEKYTDIQKYNDFLSERHGDTDGWNLGWVINNYAGYGVAKGDPLGNSDMDIFVHNGKSAPGATEWISNPSVSSSNHMSDLSSDPNSNPPYDRVTVKWNDTTMAYDAAANQKYIAWYRNVNPGFNDGNDDIGDIGDSMDVQERNPSWKLTTPNLYSGYLDPKDPRWVYENLKDDTGIAPYVYDDAFTQRSAVFEDESIGGVIAGLAGYTNYNTEDNNWGDQQVIRIDLAQNTLELVDKIIFYDFGFYTGLGASQVSPVQIVFGVMTDPTSGLRVVFFDLNKDGVFNGDDYLMPENRIYIAQVENMVPEPMTLALLGVGGLGLLKIRSRRKRA